MPAVHRLGDVDEGGGAIVNIQQGTVYVNDILASIDGSDVDGHGTGEHAGPQTANGSPTVFIGGIPVNRQGDADTCGDARAEGSPNVFADDGTAGAAGPVATVEETVTPTNPTSDSAQVQQAKAIAERLTPVVASTTAGNVELVMKNLLMADQLFPVNALNEIPFFNTVTDVSAPLPTELTPISDENKLAVQQMYKDKMETLLQVDKKKIPPTTRYPFYGDINANN